MKLTIAIVAVVLAASAAQAQQTRSCPSHCGSCAYQHTNALGRAGDARVLRLVRETQRRGGGAQVAGSLNKTRDYRSVLREVNRVCGCPSWC